MSMLRRIAIFLAAAVQLLAFSPDTPIDELKLNDGRVLHHVQIVGFSNSAMTARWDGGRGTIAYDELPAAVKSGLEDFIPARRSQSAIVTRSKSAGPSVSDIIDQAPEITPPQLNLSFKRGRGRQITGQIFITTNGAQSVKLGGVTIGLYSQRDLNEFMKWKESEGSKRERYFAMKDMRGLAQAALFDSWNFLPKSPYSCMSDADGRFSVTNDIDEPFYIFAKATRLVGGDTEYYVWVISSEKIPENGNLYLNNANMM